MTGGRGKQNPLFLFVLHGIVVKGFGLLVLVGIVD